MISIRHRATALLVAILGLGVLGSMSMSQEPSKTKAAPVAKKAALPPPPATPIDRIKVPKGFKVDLLYTVPRETQGSWVNLTFDPKGRMIASDQYGKLYRVTLPAINAPATEIKVEPISVEIGEAQGLLWAFDSLYVVVNAAGKFQSGLYRVKDTNGDDVLDQVELLRKLEGNSEHGPHAVVLAPDGKSLYVVAGNATKLPELSGSLVPRIWGEDNLLPRMVDGKGFMTDEKAPGGYICRVDPLGKSWELVSMGFRNAFDMAFNRQGDLFTFDSDMEWDMNTPWYRPTRVNLVASGADHGYRNGAGKWPTYYLDSLPPVVNIGPGSPTGVTFGYGARFPSKYVDALYLADWSYGKLYAAHLQSDGGGYSATVEEFITGTPLPLTDVVINPLDGAMYFAIGGRKTTSGLYRVTYVGSESIAAAAEVPIPAANEARRMLEKFHGHADPKAVETAWPYLSSPDRFVRYAARVAIEFQDPTTWRDKALSENNPQAALESLLALVRVSADDPAQRKANATLPDKALENQILRSLGKLKFAELPYARKLDALRVVEVLFNRFGPPDEEMTLEVIAVLDKAYPAKGRELNVELCNLLVYLNSPTVATKTLPLLENAPTQEEQIDFARALRTLKVGWTPELRRSYFSWIGRASHLKGGPSLSGFIRQIEEAAVASLTASEKAEVMTILELGRKSSTIAAGTVGPVRNFVKSWTVDELAPIVESGLKQKRDFDKGRSLFAAASCFACHRYDNEGGAAGPDLTGLAGRFSPRDLIESIILPSKVVSDQYEAVIVATTDGQVVTGRIMNLHNDTMTINTNMLDPSAQVNVNRHKIEETRPSPISMMPEGLLTTLDRDEILDLVAYLLSRGDRESAMFR